MNNETFLHRLDCFKMTSLIGECLIQIMWAYKLRNGSLKGRMVTIPSPSFHVVLIGLDLNKMFGFVHLF